MQQTKLETMLHAMLTNLDNGVLFWSLGLAAVSDSSVHVVIKEVGVCSQVYSICNIERQVTTNCLHHGCNSNH